MKIAIAGTGYVGLSNGILLSQHNEVIALDIIPEKVEMINNKKSPIEDKEIEEYLLRDDLNFKAPEFLNFFIIESRIPNSWYLQRL